MSSSCPLRQQQGKRQKETQKLKERMVPGRRGESLSPQSFSSQSRPLGRKNRSLPPVRPSEAGCLFSRGDIAECSGERGLPCRKRWGWRDEGERRQRRQGTEPRAGWRHIWLESSAPCPVPVPVPVPLLLSAKESREQEGHHY